MGLTGDRTRSESRGLFRIAVFYLVVAKPARGRVLAAPAPAAGRHRRRLRRRRADGERRKLFLDALAAARGTHRHDPLAHEQFEATSALGTAVFKERHDASITQAPEPDRAPT